MPALCPTLFRLMGLSKVGGSASRDSRSLGSYICRLALYSEELHRVQHTTLSQLETRAHSLVMANLSCPASKRAEATAEAEEDGVALKLPFIKPVAQPASWAEPLANEAGLACMLLAVPAAPPSLSPLAAGREYSSASGWRTCHPSPVFPRGPVPFTQQPHETETLHEPNYRFKDTTIPSWSPAVISCA
eukprot:scaffold266_cov391-Prasinococcus_capsulatus_cf.AAC.33